MNTWKRSLVFAVLVLLLLGLSTTPLLASSCPGTGTPGYWKNHPEVWEAFDHWTYFGLPADTTQEEVIDLLGRPTKGNKWNTLFKAAMAAKLNRVVACNRGACWDCVDDSFLKARKWLIEYYDEDVKANSEAWKEAEPWYLELDAYNNGRLCAPPRD